MTKFHITTRTITISFEIDAGMDIKLVIREIMMFVILKFMKNKITIMVSCFERTSLDLKDQILLKIKLITKPRAIEVECEMLR